MTTKSDQRSQRAAQAPASVMGEISLLTTQELAEFIDPVETVAPHDEGGDFLEYDPETF